MLLSPLYLRLHGVGSDGAAHPGPGNGPGPGHGRPGGPVGGHHRLGAGPALLGQDARQLGVSQVDPLPPVRAGSVEKVLRPHLHDAFQRAVAGYRRLVQAEESERVLGVVEDEAQVAHFCPFQQKNEFRAKPVERAFLDGADGVVGEGYGRGGDPLQLVLPESGDVVFVQEEVLQLDEVLDGVQRDGRQLGLADLEVLDAEPLPREHELVERESPGADVQFVQAVRPDESVRADVGEEIPREVQGRQIGQGPYRLRRDLAQRAEIHDECAEGRVEPGEGGVLHDVDVVPVQLELPQARQRREAAVHQVGDGVGGQVQDLEVAQATQRPRDVPDEVGPEMQVLQPLSPLEHVLGQAADVAVVELELDEGGQPEALEEAGGDAGRVAVTLVVEAQAELLQAPAAGQVVQRVVEGQVDGLHVQQHQGVAHILQGVQGQAEPRVAVEVQDGQPQTRREVAARHVAQVAVIQLEHDGHVDRDERGQVRDPPQPLIGAEHGVGTPHLGHVILAARAGVRARPPGALRGHGHHVQ